MKKNAKAPIGFGRKPDPDPNGTGDGFRLYSGDVDVEEEEESGPPPRQPKANAVFVGDIEAHAILMAYSLFPLTPLSLLEHQLIQVIAGLEKELEKYTQEL
ncbi:hypothetical protein MUN82_06510 [Hymenobacter aerilatus]|uniref:Uncharacterized protein n=1 Tax=Hymenobacter aerilatus TaxID=2932251 RepID=A0A8T9SYI0_9BACT|nr:hypothetical protein [Hymenobacter aerilatus]UOR06747.1 hypothetical protein MUN82_06510 [Hymenobacter aerilatus]